MSYYNYSSNQQQNRKQQQQPSQQHYASNTGDKNQVRSQGNEWEQFFSQSSSAMSPSTRENPAVAVAPSYASSRDDYNTVKAANSDLSRHSFNSMGNYPLQGGNRPYNSGGLSNQLGQMPGTYASNQPQTLHPSNQFQNPIDGDGTYFKQAPQGFSSTTYGEPSGIMKVNMSVNNANRMSGHRPSPLQQSHPGVFSNNQSFNSSGFSLAPPHHGNKFSSEPNDLYSRQPMTNNERNIAADNDYENFLMRNEAQYSHNPSMQNTGGNIDMRGNRMPFIMDSMESSASFANDPSPAFQRQVVTERNFTRGGSVGGQQGNFSKSHPNPANAGTDRFSLPNNNRRPVGKWSSHYQNPLNFPISFIHNRGVRTRQNRVIATQGDRNISTFSQSTTVRNAAMSSKSSTLNAGKRDRSPLGISRSRSRSPVRRRRKERGRKDDASPSRGRRARSRSRSPTSKGVQPDQRGKPTTASIASAVDTSSVTARPKNIISTLSLHDLCVKHHFPTLTRSVSGFSALDLNERFPNLYVPADFVEIIFDWPALDSALLRDYFLSITKNVPILFENNPSLLTSHTNLDKDPDSHPDLTLPAKFTYLQAPFANNRLIQQPDPYHQIAQSLSINVKPIKFNVRVLVCCGLKDPEMERIDHTLTRKLRMLCGKRKNNLILLGTAWNEELDGGNPLFDRSCLFRTARRAVFAQSLIDISRGDSNLTRLCEVTYHRPKEEIKGKTFPEQMEVTTIYLHSLQDSMVPELLSAEGTIEWDAQWTTFENRVRGKHCGPILYQDPDVFSHKVKSSMLSSDFLAHEEALEDYGHIQTSFSEETAKSKEDQEVSVESSGVGLSSTAEIHDATDATQSVEAEAVGQNNKEIVFESDQKSTFNSLPASSLSAEKKVSEMAVNKPASPNVLICPMPLPNEGAIDSTVKQEGLSLRMIPLSTLLSYSQDDCNERVFEVSLAAEIVKALITINFANVITDFLLAESGDFENLVDQRMIAFVRKLRELNAASKKKVLDATTTDVAAVPADPAAVVTIESKSQTKLNEPEPEEQAENIQGYDEQHSVSNDMNVAAENVVTVTNEYNNTEKSISVNEEAIIEAIDCETNDDHERSANISFAITEEEARVSRRHFVHACRWFDLQQERFLKSESLFNIIQLSTRLLSRADCSALSEDVCGEAEKLRYETFI